MATPGPLLDPEPAQAPEPAAARIAALEAQNRELLNAVRHEIPSLRASLKMAAEVVEYAEAAMLAAQADRQAAQDRAEKAERSLARVRHELEGARGTARRLIEAREAGG
jgi:signal transduction histidine kinase